MVVNDRMYLTEEYTVSEFPTIPPGTYDATLEGVTEEEHDLYGLRWVWHWMIPDMDPEGGDYEIQVWTPPRLSSTGMASEQARALGAKPAKGTKVSLGALRGQRARLIVTLDEEKGRNRVKGVMPAPMEPPAPSAPVIDAEYQAYLTEKAKRQAADAEEPPAPSEPAGEPTA